MGVFLVGSSDTLRTYDLDTGDDIVINDEMEHTTKGLAFAVVGAVTDRDGDGIVDMQDNCPDDKNADQLDSDGDRIGDECDVFPFDFDNDGIDDSEDNCPRTPNEDQADVNKDGEGDACNNANVDCTFIDPRNAINDNDIISDAIHPTTSGSLKLANLIWPELADKL